MREKNAASGDKSGKSGELGRNQLEEAIYAAVAYRDIFEFPMTVAEIHRTLPHYHCTKSAVESALYNGGLVPDLLTTDGEFFALQGREICFATRRKRHQHIAKLRTRAAKFGRLLATVPFVEMIAISGSLAAENPGEHADIDFFVLIRAGHLWRTRILIRILKRLDFSVGTRTLCPNSMRTTAAMTIEFERLYMAQELAQMLPIYGFDLYQQMMQCNAWFNHFLPNAEQAAQPTVDCKPYCVPLKRGLEWLLDTPLGDWYERWTCERRIAEFSAPGHVFHTYSPFTREHEGLNLAFAETVEQQLQTRLLNR